MEMESRSDSKDVLRYLGGGAYRRFPAIFVGDPETRLVP